LWHKDTDLQDCDAIAVPGGFTYGDYLRSGALARFSPIMKKVVEFAHNGGLVFGVCNGFQILCEAGLLPGTLLHNENQKFICKNQYIKVENTDTAMTMFVDKDKALKIPIAHGQGRYYAPDSTLQEMLQNGQIVWRYCDEDGKLNQKANPNGSVMNIAGVCNVEKNVFGMMPHPERAADPELKNTHGLIIFKSMIEYFNEQKMLGKKEMN
jgi:phosphoribosylformylglycinamidine synthase